MDSDTSDTNPSHSGFGQLLMAEWEGDRMSMTAFGGGDGGDDAAVAVQPIDAPKCDCLRHQYLQDDLSAP